jgi:hypothetical protein
MGGRKTGFPSGAQAEERVAALYREAGLAPGGANGGWFHEFEFSTSEVAPPIALSVGGEAVPFGVAGFTDLTHAGEGVVEAEVVFVGYGLHRPAVGWDDYEGADVAGKIVLAIRGVPTSREGDFDPEDRMIGRKSSLARDRGAAGFLIAEGKNAVTGTIQERFHRVDLPAVWITGAVADKIVAPRGRTFADLKRQRDAGEPGKSFGTGTTVRLEVHGRLVPKAKGRNVVARIDGADPALGKEAVLVGAHLDHLGSDPLGRVFNGADDNASGSASVLHLAETLVRAGWTPKRTVLFVGFAGEEQGLVGAQAMAKDMPFPDRTLVAMVNVDMTGQGKPVCGLAGTEGWPKTTRLLRERLGEETWKGLRIGRAQPNSDHWPFLARGVPAVFAMTDGDHPNYHQITDDAANLKPECLEAAARVVGRMLLALADHPEPLAGREALEERVLYEGGRIVEGTASARTVASLRLQSFSDDPLASVGDSKEVTQAALAAFADNAWGGVVVFANEEREGPVVHLARYQELAKAAKDRVVLVSSASDLANAVRAGRIALVPRLACSKSVRAFPGVIATYRGMGFRWIAPFAAQDRPAPVLVDLVVASAAEAGVVLDVTGLPTDDVRRVRAHEKGKDLPLVLSLPGVSSGTESGDAAIRAARLAVGAPGVVVVDPSEALLRDALRGGKEDPSLAALVVTSEDSDALRALLRAALAEAGPAVREPEHPGRQRIRTLLGGAWVDLFRRAR